MKIKTICLFVLSILLFSCNKDDDKEKNTCKIEMDVFRFLYSSDQDESCINKDREKAIKNGFIFDHYRQIYSLTTKGAVSWEGYNDWIYIYSSSPLILDGKDIWHSIPIYDVNGNLSGSFMISEVNDYNLDTEPINITWENYLYGIKISMDKEENEINQNIELFSECGSCLSFSLNISDK